MKNDNNIVVYKKFTILNTEDMPMSDDMHIFRCYPIHIKPKDKHFRCSVIDKQSNIHTAAHYDSMTINEEIIDGWYGVNDNNEFYLIQNPIGWYTIPIKQQGGMATC